MSLSKLISLLTDNSLYFSRADRLGDAFEGSLGLKSMQSVWEASYLRNFSFLAQHSLGMLEGEQVLQSGIPNVTLGLRHTHQELKDFALASVRNWARHGQELRKRHFVSCWHESEHESESQWRIYGENDSGGIAMCTNFGNLQKSLGDDPDIQIGRVEYVDYAHTLNTHDNAIFRKRQSLNYESEVRAVIWGAHDWPESKYGVKRLIKTDLLVNKIVVSPFADAWFPEIVQEIMKRFELDKPVEPSEISFEPLF